MQHSRQALGESWVLTYLSSPIWRFALARGVCGENAWMGLMMPSVDRVGRHFPLTLAVCMDEQALLFDSASLHDAWFRDLEELALSSLAAAFSLEDFDTALCNLGAPIGSHCTGIASASGAGTMITLDPARAMQPQLAAPSAVLMRALTGAALHQHSLWWTEGSQQIAPCMLVCNGLPAAGAFAALFDGAWSTNGWGAV